MTTIVMMMIVMMMEFDDDDDDDDDDSDDDDSDDDGRRYDLEEEMLWMMIISKATKVKDVSSRAPYNRVSKLPDSSPPIMNVLQQLSLTAAAFEVMGGRGERRGGGEDARAGERRR
eukprot:766903-Hanusia_phi.AAC.2